MDNKYKIGDILEYRSGYTKNIVYMEIIEIINNDKFLVKVTESNKHSFSSWTTVPYFYKNSAIYHNSKLIAHNCDIARALYL